MKVPWPSNLNCVSGVVQMSIEKFMDIFYMSRTAMPQFPKVYMKASQILDGDTIIDETMKQHLLRYFI